MCGMLTGQEPAAGARQDKRRSPTFPTSSVPSLSVKKEQGDVYAQRMFAFEAMLARKAKPTRKRRSFHDYTDKNCEEAWGGR